MAGDKDPNSPPETSQSKPEVSKNVPEVSEHASQILANMVNALNEENKSPADVKAVMEMAKAAVPELTSQQAEIVTTVLVEISGNVTPDIVQETVEIAAEVKPGLCVNLIISLSLLLPLPLLSMPLIYNWIYEIFLSHFNTFFLFHLFSLSKICDLFSLFYSHTNVCGLQNLINEF